MRTVILIGLLYIAYCINPIVFDKLSTSLPDIILIGFVSIFAFISDLKDLFK